MPEGLSLGIRLRVGKALGRADGAVEGFSDGGELELGLELTVGGALGETEAVGTSTHASFHAVYSIAFFINTKLSPKEERNW